MLFAQAIRQSNRLETNAAEYLGQNDLDAKLAAFISAKRQEDMMARTFEYNVDGSYHIIEDTPDGGLIIHHNQDVKAAVDWATKQRNHGVNDFGGVRDNSDLKHYATVPMGAILSMREEGIDFWNKDHEKAMLKWIERNASQCKVTNRKIV